MRDADGYFSFVGRADGVIKSAGHLIGPFEVESALMEHHAVAEAGVIGTPDPVAGEIVKAFISLKPGYLPDEALARELLGHARKRLDRPWRRKRSRSAPLCREPAAARSCAACCALVSSGCRKAISRTSRTRRHGHDRMRQPARDPFRTLGPGA